MKVRLHRNELLAVALFASKDESRFALNAVRVEAAPGKRPLLVATDGRRLCVLESHNEQPEDAEPGSVSLATGAVKALAQFSKGIGGKLYPLLEITQSLNRPDMALEVKFCDADGNAFGSAVINSGAVVAAEFPNWRAAAPERVQRTPVRDLAINAEYMGDFGRLAAILDKPPTVQMNLLGQGAAVEVINPQIPNWYALIMPCVAEDVNYQPEFIALAESEQQSNEGAKHGPPDEGEEKVTMVTPGMKPVTVTADKFKRLGKRVQAMEAAAGHES